MGIAFIKKLNENIPYWLKKPFSKFIRKKLISNKVFLSTYRMLENSDKVSVSDLKNKQLEKLRNTLVHAYHHTKYYHALFDSIEFNPETIKSVEEIKRIPLLTKTLLNERLEELTADDVIDYYNVSTGGTSGEPTVVLMEKDAIYKEWGFVYYYWSKFGYDFKKSKLATFRGVSFGKKICEINPLYSEIRMNSFLMGNKNIRKYLKEIDKYGCEFIYGYPSTVYNFCRLVWKLNIDIKGKFHAAFLISENLYDFQKKVIEEVLDCPIAMFYGHSERAVFGEQFDGIYHFNMMYGYTEFSEAGEPIVTGFVNQKTPLIRYVVDDFVKKQQDGYVILGHHDSEVLYGKDGEQISSAAINFHDDTFEGISMYQFEQDNPGECVLKVVISSNLGLNRLNLIEERVNNKIGHGVRCIVESVDNIEYTARGKYKMIIQNWKE